MQDTLSRVAFLSVDGPAGSEGTWAGGNEGETAHSCARTGARVSHAPSGLTLWGRTRYHSHLTDEDTEARGRARKAELPAAVDGCPPDFRLSQRGDPKGACYTGEHQGRGPVARRGCCPAVSTVARERLLAEKKEEQMSGQTWPRVNKTGTRAQDAETKVAGKAPRGPGGCPLCLCMFPGLTKAAAVSQRCHLQLRPLGLWQHRLAEGQKVQSQQTLCFSEGHVLRCGGGPAIGGTCLSLYCTLEGR